MGDDALWEIGVVKDTERKHDGAVYRDSGVFFKELHLAFFVLRTRESI